MPMHVWTRQHGSERSPKFGNKSHGRVLDRGGTPCQRKGVALGVLINLTLFLTFSFMKS